MNVTRQSENFRFEIHPTSLFINYFINWISYLRVHLINVPFFLYYVSVLYLCRVEGIDVQHKYRLNILSIFSSTAVFCIVLIDRNTYFCITMSGIDTTSHNTVCGIVVWPQMFVDNRNNIVYFSDYSNGTYRYFVFSWQVPD